MWPALIGAGASLLGGLLSSSNQQDINQQNIANQQAINAQNIAMQKEFAQNGIQWKVDDAKAAGLNPLAALGASTSSFSNVVGSTSQASPAFGAGVAAAGQDISRALKDTMAAGDQHTVRMQQLQETHGELENQLLASQIAKNNSAGAGGPPTPAAGQQWLVAPGVGPVDPATAQTDPIKRKPQEVYPAVGPGGESMPAVNPSTQWVKMGGGLYPVMSDTMARGTSNDSLANLMYRVQNMVGLGDTPPFDAGKDRRWINAFGTQYSVPTFGGIARGVGEYFSQPYSSPGRNFGPYRGWR